MTRIPPLLAAALLIGGCAGRESPAPEAAAPALPRGQLVHVLLTTSSVDSAAGELARAGAADPRVRAFGARIAADHGAAGRAAAELAARLGVAPAGSAVSDRFLEDAARNRAVLARESGAEFDRVFLENEVEYHRTMLETLDGTLLPAAADPALGEHLRQVRPVVEAHLRHAQALLDSLAAGT